MIVAIICLIVAVILTVKVGQVLFRNTVGTGSAYAWRYMLIFFIILAILAGLCNKAGIL